MNVNELNQIYEEMMEKQFKDRDELIRYVDKNLATVIKSDGSDFTIEKNGKSYTLCFDFYHSVQQMVEDITRAIQILNGLDIEGVHNTPQLISRLNAMKKEEESMEKLNTMESFLDGFRIKRDGKVITLTNKEMSRFRYLDRAVDGRNVIDVNADCIEDDEILDRMKNDEAICNAIENDILDCVFDDCGETEIDVLRKHIVALKREFYENKH